MDDEAVITQEERDRKDRLDWMTFCRAIEAGDSLDDALVKVCHDRWWFGQMFKRPKLKKKYEDAKAVRMEMRKERCDDAVFRRAVDGVPRIVASGGKLIGEDRIYSDKLLEILYMKDHPELMPDRGGGNTNIDFFLQQIENATPIGKPAQAELVREALAAGRGNALPGQQQQPLVEEQAESRQ